MLPLESFCVPLGGSAIAERGAATARPRRLRAARGAGECAPRGGAAQHGFTSRLCCGAQPAATAARAGGATCIIRYAHTRQGCWAWGEGAVDGVASRWSLLELGSLAVGKSGPSISQS